MSTRRSFLIGAGAGLIAPRLLDRFANFLEIRGEPLILAPKRPTNVLFVERDRKLLLCLDYVSAPFFWPGTEATWDRGERVYRSTRHNFAAIYTCLQIRKRSPGPLAALDGAGGIRFGPWFWALGHGWGFAYCEDLLSVSLLQARLNDLGTGIAVTLGDSSGVGTGHA